MLPDSIIKEIGNYLAFGIAGNAKSITETMLQQLDNQLGDDFKIGASDFGVLGSLKYWENFYSTIRDTNSQLGIAGQLGRDIETTMADAFKQGVKYGLSIEEIAGSYKKLSDIVSVNRLINPEDVTTVALFTKAYGEGFEKIFANLSMYGVSIERVNELTTQAMSDANDIGLSTSKVLKGVRDNIGAIDRITFQTGIAGLSRLVQLSERYKFNVDSIIGFADNNRMLDSIMDTSAQLQVLGGQFSQLGDPFELGFLARNNPEILTERIIELSKAYATMNESGEMVIDPFGLDQIKEFARITGMASEELVRLSKISGLTSFVSDKVSEDIRAAENYEKLIEKIAANAYFDEDTGGYVMNIMVGGEVVKKTIEEVDKDDLKKLSAIGEGTSLEQINKELILANETLGSKFERLIETFKRYTISENLYRMTNDEILKLTKDFRLNMEDVPFAQKTKVGLDVLDESIFDTFFERANILATSADDMMPNYMSKDGLGSDLEGLEEALKNLITLINSPGEYIFGDFYKSMESAGQTITSWQQKAEDFGKTGNKLITFMRGGGWNYSSISGGGQEQKSSDDTQKKLIEINQQSVLKDTRNLTTQIKENFTRIDTSGDKKISFKEFKGSITILDKSGKELDNMDMSKIFKQIEPELKQLIMEGFHDEATNQRKYNPQSKKSSF